MKKLRSILKWALLIWGAISLIGILILLCSTAYYGFGPGNSDKIGKASEKDVRFVLNWCRLGDARIEKVLHSHESARSFTGDHLDAYAIKVKNLTISDLKNPESDFDGGWIRCDKLDPIISGAVKLVSGFAKSDQLDWFPQESDLLSDRYYIWIWSIGLQGRRPGSAKIIFAHPESGVLYYSSVKI
ncbi:MAG: hypothetical protein LBG65_00300 [Puniceicoccales bacterium]|jgi:hypothetical protein|nr:hypothetical protein [Puniceicoccales bacterium]